MSEIIEVVIDDQTIYFESAEEIEGFEKLGAKDVGENPVLATSRSLLLHPPANAILIDESYAQLLCNTPL